MSGLPRMFELPKRVSLSTQAATSIRQAIQEGSWMEHLPSERRLCELFRVSRPTIRAALHILASEGLLDIHQGRKNRILAREAPRQAPASRLVGLVTHEPVSQLSQTAYHSISEMRTHLAGHGFATEILVIPPTGSRTQRLKVESFLRENRVFCCVLSSVSKDVQQWFSESSIPALVLGSCHPDITLPSLGVDFRSVCRHAAGEFLRRGHRRMALIIPNTGIAGDLESEQGFKEGVSLSSARDEATALVVRHKGTAQNITNKLDLLFNSPRPPTALLVAKPWYVFAVIIYLLKHGIAVPDTVSLIARDSDKVFASVNPAISHYLFENDAFVHPLIRMMLKLVSQGALPPKPTLVFPTFFEGDTVKQPPRRV
jgi:DNA-binding LacI/PurR family transcriptional regulator